MSAEARATDQMAQNTTQGCLAAENLTHARWSALVRSPDATLNGDVASELTATASFYSTCQSSGNGMSYAVAQQKSAMTSAHDKVVLRISELGGTFNS